MPRRYEAVLFDLLTALLDSWTLWNDVAASDVAGRNWRAAYLRRTYGTGAYRPYDELVAEAAAEIGLDQRLTDALSARYAELRPWPGVPDALASLVAAGIPLGVATNCSEALGRVAAGCAGAPFVAMVTAERAGFYKPAPQPYLLALQELGVSPQRCLFVAGSAYDLIGMARPADAPEPLRHMHNLEGLAEFVLGE